MKIQAVSVNSFAKLNKFDSKKNINFKQDIAENKDTKKLNKKYLILAALAFASIAAFVVSKKAPILINNKKTVDKAKEIIVTGSENVKKIVGNLKADDYDSSKVFRANLHIHSTASDGKLSPLEILNQAVECSKKLPSDEKFIFSLTDHDSISGVLEIADEITKNPDKYSKLKFIPGVELSVKHHNPNLSKKPVELDFLIYGFDVNDKKIQTELNRRKNYLLAKTSDLINLINEECSTKLTMDDLNLEQFPLVKNTCSNGYLKSLKECIKSLLGGHISDESLDRKILKIFGDERYAYEANISLADAVGLAKDVNSFASLAHPGKFSFNRIQLIDKHTKLVDDIFNTFFERGGNAIEYNYMSYNPHKTWWPEVQARLDNLKSDFFKTGGYDTHGLSILSKH